jgi:thioredoxin
LLEFDQLVSSLGPQQLLVIDFHAVWCGPCHAIAPIYAQLANQYAHVKFAKIDVDQQQQLAARFKVSAMPTFKFLKGGREIAELRGASPPQLTALVKQHAGSPAAAKPAAPAEPLAPLEGSLLSHVASTGLSCLGENKDHPLSSIIGPNAGPKGRSYLESDVDPELLISMQVSVNG